jgi:glycosyltransferase involved in cell wall biosynthesis
VKVALIGSRGIPACYSGFETFYEQIGYRLAQRGHTVTVYNRTRFARPPSPVYRGMRLVGLPSIPTKHLDTISHTLLASLHAMLLERYDIAYYVIAGNSPLAWLPRLTGTKTLLNVDGEDWAREKWGAFARWYQRRSENMACRTPNVVIADAIGIRERYRTVYGKETVFVPYGANVGRDEGTETLKRFGLRPRNYLLFVGRLVPENALELVLQAYASLRTDMPLVVVGDAPYAETYKRRMRELAGPNVVFTGYAFGASYAQLSSHAYLYIQPSAIDGTRPALLDQLGFGNAVLVRGSKVNREVVGTYGECFDADSPESSLHMALGQLLANPARVEALRRNASERISTFYNWEWITDFHEDLFERMLDGRKLVSYDQWIEARSDPAQTTGNGG